MIMKDVIIMNDDDVRVQVLLSGLTRFGDRGALRHAESFTIERRGYSS